jgi:hypothetical protein
VTKHEAESTRVKIARSAAKIRPRNRSGTQRLISALEKVQMIDTPMCATTRNTEASGSHGDQAKPAYAAIMPR